MSNNNSAAISATSSVNNNNTQEISMDVQTFITFISAYLQSSFPAADAQAVYNENANPFALLKQYPAELSQLQAIAGSLKFQQQVVKAVWGQHALDMLVGKGFSLTLKDNQPLVEANANGFKAVNQFAFSQFIAVTIGLFIQEIDLSATRKCAVVERLGRKLHSSVKNMDSIFPVKQVDESKIREIQQRSKSSEKSERVAAYMETSDILGGFYSPLMGKVNQVQKWASVYHSYETFLFFTRLLLQDRVVISENELGASVRIGQGLFTVSKDGQIYDNQKRPVLCSFIVNKEAAKKEFAVANPHTGYLTTPYGSFLLAISGRLASIASTSAKNTEKLNVIYSQLISDLNFNSDENSAADNSGERNAYTRYQANDVMFGDAAFGIHNGKLGCSSPIMLESSIAAANTDAFALYYFNLVRMHKGCQKYFNASQIMTQIRHYGEYAEAALEALLAATKPGVPLNVAISELLEASTETASEQDMYKFAVENTVFMHSTKKAKATKRVGLQNANSAWAIAPVSRESTSLSRGFKLMGQEEFSKGYPALVCLAPSLMGPAGMAYTIEENWGFYAPSSFDITVANGKLALVKVTLDGLSQVSTEREVRWESNCGVEINGTFFKGVQVDQDTILGVVGEQEIVAPQAMLVRNVRANIDSFGQLIVKVNYFDYQTISKIRNGVKGMTGRTPAGKSMLYNSMNANLPEGIELILPQDVCKYGDLAWGHLDTIARTAMEHQYGQDILGVINSAVGATEDGSEGIVWSSTGAITGLYQPLFDWFEQTFGRSIWFQNQMDANLFGALKEMYLNKVEDAEDNWCYCQDRNILSMFTRDAVIIQQGEKLTEKTNILVFFKNGSNTNLVDNSYSVWQRSFAYVGSDKVGAPIMTVKTEMSPVKDGVSNTLLMPDVAAVIGTGFAGVPGSNESVEKLMSSVQSQHNGYTALLQCVARKPFAVIDSVEGDSVEQITVIKASLDGKTANADLVAALKSIEGETLSLKEYGFALYTTAIDLGHVWLHVPSILANNTCEDMLSTLAGATLAFLNAMRGGKYDIDLAKQISNTMRKLSESAGKLKQIRRGRMSAQAKGIAIPGLPISELWVERNGETHRALKKAFKAFNGDSKIDGRKVIMTRSPMPFPAAFTVRLINKNSPEAWAVNSCTFSINPLGVYPSAGKFVAPLLSN